MRTSSLAQPFGPEALARAEQVATAVVDAAVEVHSRLGPGLLERTYVLCLGQVLRGRGFDVALEVPVPLSFDGLEIATAFRIDMVVDGLVVVEIKTVDMIHKVHLAQVRTYVKIAGKPLGFLLNFDEYRMSHGIRRVAHPEYDA